LSIPEDRDRSGGCLGGVAVLSSGRSTRCPLVKVAPLRTSGTRWGALTAPTVLGGFDQLERHREAGGSGAGSLVTRVRWRTARSAAVYVEAGTSLRRALNKVIFEKLYVDDGQVTAHTLNTGLAELVEAGQLTSKRYLRRVPRTAARGWSHNDTSPILMDEAGDWSTAAGRLEVILSGHGSNKTGLVDLLDHYSNRRPPERGVRGGRPRGWHDEWPLARAFRGQGPPRTLVGDTGIEPVTSSV
jgi:hypothetical protein